MSADKKEKEPKFKCNPHHYIITQWVTKGGIQNATNMRCAQCLTAISLEELQSKELRESMGI